MSVLINLETKNVLNTNLSLIREKKIKLLVISSRANTQRLSVQIVTHLKIT